MPDPVPHIDKRYLAALRYEMLRWVMADLAACTRAQQTYHAFRIPGLLRVLILDSDPDRRLYTQISADFGLRLTAVHGFVYPKDGPLVPVGEFPPLQSVGARFDPFRDAGQNYQPFPTPHWTRRDVPTTIDIELVQDLVVVRTDLGEMDVKALVLDMGYVVGALHSGSVKASKPAQQRLLDARAVEDPMQRQWFGSSDTLRAIGSVYHRALLPLLDACTPVLGRGPIRFEYQIDDPMSGHHVLMRPQGRPG